MRVSAAMRKPAMALFTDSVDSFVDNAPKDAANY